MKFVGRTAELTMLDRFYRHHQAALLILYGRQAVGKSRLVTHWLKTRHIDDVFYWTAPAQEPAWQLQDFSRALTAFDPRPEKSSRAEPGYSNWRDALSQLADLAAHRSEQPTLVIIDNFTHLLRRDPSVASDFQIAWDHHLSRRPNLRLALIGTADSLMEHEVLSIRAPLYGRATFLYRLRPLNFADLYDLFRGWSPEERVAGYAVTGGYPPPSNGLLVQTVCWKVWRA